MEELSLSRDEASTWFTETHVEPFELISVSVEHSQSWSASFCLPVRRCYVADGRLTERATANALSESDVLRTYLPDPGATMAGDFGEILVYCYLACKAAPLCIFGPKKWRLKQDRTKPAPYSDVIHFSVPSWPNPSKEDVLYCSEVKTKSTLGTFSPIEAAIQDCQKDRTSRLSKTLVWLKERAIRDGLGSTQIAHLERFIDAIDYPPYQKKFYAVAIICDSLLAQELVKAPTSRHTEYSLIVISVPNLRETYMSIFGSGEGG